MCCLAMMGFGYYETVCGGCGAGSGHYVGASAVHSHMTNTAITDPEIMEHRYPVRLERFCLASRIGGQRDAMRGGDGVIREITFLQPMSRCRYCQPTSHRVATLRRLAGGQPGIPGSGSVLVRRSGRADNPWRALMRCEGARRLSTIVWFWRPLARRWVGATGDERGEQS